MFNLRLPPPPPPPLTINVALTGATVAPAKGSGSVTGTVTCSNDANVFVQGDISQKAAGTVAFGHYGAFVYCTAGSSNAWTAGLSSEPVRGSGRSSSLLRGGPASFFLFADGFDVFGQGASTTTSGSVNLKAGH